MIIFNEREYNSPFVRENKVIDINSTEKDLASFIKKVEAGEDISESCHITVTRFIPYADYKEELKFEPFLAGTPEGENISGSYAKTYTQHELEVLNDESIGYRHPIFEEYEKTLFEQHTNFVFTEDKNPLPQNELLEELYAAYEILPTLWKEEMSLEDKKKYSADGEKMMRIFTKDDMGKVSKDNPIPSKARIEFYQSLNDYEKRIINSGRIHPKLLTDIAIRLRMEPTEKDPGKMTGFLLTNDILEDMLEVIDYNSRLNDEIKRCTNPEEKKELEVRRRKVLNPSQIADEKKSGFSKKYPEALKRAEEAFKKEFHGRSPMVLSWYMEGQLRFRGIDPDKMTDEELDAIVKNFHQPNVKRVANYRNATLFGLDGILNFGNTKDQLIEYIGVQITPERAKSLEEKGFFTWLSKYSNITIALLDKVLKYEGNIKKFDLDLDPKKTYQRAKNERGFRDSQLYESKYKYRFQDNEVAIKGRNTVVTLRGMTMRFLDADDYANFTIGYDTQCCQHWGNAGESCVWEYTTDPFAAGVVIEENDEVVAQAFVFTNEETSTFVFDNIEFSTKRDRNADTNAHSKFMGIIDTFANALPYKNVHIGMGYNALGNGIGEPINKEEFVPMPTTIKNGHVYSDYHQSNARVIKRDGKLIGREAVEPAAKVSVKPDEPTRWDELASPAFSYMLNNCNLSPEERIATAREFLGNPSEEAQMRMVRAYPQAVLALENPCHEAQLYLLNNPGTTNLISKIKNPCIEVQVALFNRDPGYIRNANNLPEEFKIRALQANGLLLEVMPQPTDEMIKTALKQNGYAIRYVPKENWTEEYMKLSVSTSPKAITLFEDVTYSDAVIREAVAKNPEVFSLSHGASEEARRFALEQKPGLIIHMDEPTYEEAKYAIEQNGLLIRNLQYQFPELRERAIRQNPWAIGALHDVTFDEAMLAISINPNVQIRIKDPTLLDEIHLAMDLNAGPVNTDLSERAGIDL
mgnify:CR=1 FL=1